MKTEVKQILEDVRSGEMSVDEALMKLKMSPYEDIGYAKIDMHRKIRKGFPEVIYGAGKTPEQIRGIVDAMQDKGQSHTYYKDVRGSRAALSRRLRFPLSS